MNFLEHLFLHVSHSLVVRILASSAGDLGSNPGGVHVVWERNDNGNLGVVHGVLKRVVEIEFI
jgi:hypothetical protein